MDWGYVAGYFDGEGSVNMSLTKRGDMTRGLSWHNTHRASLEAIQAFIGVGSVYSKSHGTLGKKPMFVLQVGRKVEMLYILDGMLPYLIIKRDAAEALRQHLILNVDEHRWDHFGAVAAISTEQLTQWYHVEGKSYAKIAAMLHVKPEAIGQAFRVRGLQARPAGGSTYKGVAMSEEAKARMRATHQKLWADPTFREEHLPNLAKGREAAKKRPKENYRGGPPSGEAHPQAKLTDEQVAAIRTRYAEGGTSLNKLALEYAVSKKTILLVVHRKIWTHVP